MHGGEVVVAERRRSGVTEAFSKVRALRGDRAVLVALLNVVRVDSPAHSALSSSSKPSTTAGAAAGPASAGVSTGGERRARRGHDLVLPIHLVESAELVS